MLHFMDTLKPYQKLSAGTLKIIAIITMLIDHFAAGVYFQLYYSKIVPSIGVWKYGVEFYNLCRNIGRFAFPVFCFLLVESFFYTKSRLKYLRNLVIFAVVSEIPYDILLFSAPNFVSQNVFFTLAIALIVIWCVHTLRERCEKHMFFSMLLQVVCVLLGCFLANVCATDYGYYGVILIAIFYYFRDNRVLACIIGYILFLFEPWCIFAFIAVLFYNGKRGVNLKYFFYAFYPVHLLLLYGLKIVLMGR